MEESKLILDGRLEVHTNGTIYRIKSDGSKVLAPAHGVTKNKDMMVVCAQMAGKQQHYYVHRLVAETFLPNPDNKPNVRHKDGDGSNNHVDNLEWVNKREHALKGLEKRCAVCLVCGKPTYTENHICRSCKQKAKSKDISIKNEEQRKSDIENAMNLINMSLLTPMEQQTVDLRKQYLSYEEIGELMGCSKQCVEQRLRNATEKSLLGPKPKKTVLRKRESVESRLSRLKSKRSYLENQLAILTADIEFNEKKLVLLESEQFWQKETPAAVTARESGNLKN